MSTAKIICISNKHSEYHGKNLFINMQGGSPYFAYIWIDDVCYTLRKGARTYTLNKTRIEKV